MVCEIWALCCMSAREDQIHAAQRCFLLFFSTKRYKYFPYFSMKTYVVGTHQYLHVFVGK